MGRPGGRSRSNTLTPVRQKKGLIEERKQCYLPGYGPDMETVSGPVSEKSGAWPVLGGRRTIPAVLIWRRGDLP
jgi:hypothetical protein